MKYQYQQTAANQVLKMALDKNYEAAILAACPGAGKTTISHIIINKYLNQFPDARILVLTEGQSCLAEQYLGDLTNSNIEINFTFSDLKGNGQIRVGIPQSINKLDWNKIDLLIIDEAQNFYLKDMIQNIINKLKPVHQLLLTGSPTKFVGRKEYGIHFVSAEELLDNGVFNSVDTDLISISDARDIHSAIAMVLHKAKADRLDTSKIMIACPTIKGANQVRDYLNYHTDRKVAISTSKDDPNSQEITDFKAGKYDVLIVVGRGILGFNDPNVTLLVDLRKSENLDASYQLFARVLRRHPSKEMTKNYIRVTNRKDWNKSVLFLHKMIALMRREIFTQYNGKNLTVGV